MSAQTDAMRVTASQLESEAMSPWKASFQDTAMLAASQLRTAAANQDTLAGRLSLLGISIPLLPL